MGRTTLCQVYVTPTAPLTLAYRKHKPSAGAASAHPPTLMCQTRQDFVTIRPCPKSGQQPRPPQKVSPSLRFSQGVKRPLLREVK